MTEQNLTILLTNAAGEMVAQGAGTAMEGFGLPVAGRYYVTVLTAGGLPEAGALDFSLSFAQEAAPMAETADLGETVVPFAPGELLVISGLQFQVQWESLANLDLEVRDPVGGSVYFSRPVTESGGLFGVNVNSVCETRSSALPTEQANWSAGSIPTGSYEILVYNQQLGDCPTSSAADFRIDLRLDDLSAAPMVGSLAPGQDLGRQRDGRCGRHASARREWSRYGRNSTASKHCRAAAAGRAAGPQSSTDRVADHF